MEKIIVPVDFSAASANACLWAQKMATILNTSVEVLHVFTTTFSINEPLLVNAERNHHQLVLQQLNEFIDQVASLDAHEVATKVKTEPKLVEGSTVNSIVELSKEASTVMIVMGTTGSHDRVEYWLGSISSGVAQKAHCPVLLVPKDQPYRRLENILYTSNFESADEVVIDQILEFTQLIGSRVHFIHVNEKGDKENYAATENRIFNQLFEDGEPKFAFNLATIDNASVLEGIEQYAQENDIDLVVLVNRQRSFFENILQQSLTQKLALRGATPLLVFHI